jgi:hypothetical protein
MTPHHTQHDNHDTKKSKTIPSAHQPVASCIRLGVTFSTSWQTACRSKWYCTLWRLRFFEFSKAFSQTPTLSSCEVFSPSYPSEVLKDGVEGGPPAEAAGPGGVVGLTDVICCSSSIQNIRVVIPIFDWEQGNTPPLTEAVTGSDPGSLQVCYKDIEALQVLGEILILAQGLHVGQDSFLIVLDHTVHRDKWRGLNLPHKEGNCSF